MDIAVTPPRIAIVATHPIQYYSPWFAHLARLCDLQVFYAHRQTPEGQAAAGFAAPFDWDLPLLDGYAHQFLANRSTRPGLGQFDGCDTPEIGEIIRGGRFDAVVTLGWNKKSYLQAASAAQLSGVPLLVRVDSQLRTPRGAGKRLLKRALYSCLLPWAAHYLSPGRRSDEYLRHYGVGPERIHRLAHMVDTERFAGGAQAARASGGVDRLRGERGVGRGDFVFLFIGKLIALKQPMLMLEAFERLARSEPRAHLWIVGDGPLRSQLAAAARSERISLLGFVNQSQLPQVYAACDCLVLPSSEETWGLVVNEAFACGVPAIVSEDAGCAADLIDADTGWTVRPVDAAALAHVMAIAFERATSLPRRALAAKTMAGSYATGAAQLLGAVNTVLARKRRGGSPARRANEQRA
jgi:glycosyltransferase involved in cell wall biosynthesis